MSRAYLQVSLLVGRHDLPQSALSISTYHSQSCEATFRLTRSMSGAFSSTANFIIEQFLKRTGELCVLTEMENKSLPGQLDCPLQFPKHHKWRQKNAASNSSIDLLTNDSIEKTICRSSELVCTNSIWKKFKKISYDDSQFYSSDLTMWYGEENPEYNENPRNTESAMISLNYIHVGLSIKIFKWF